MRSRASTVWFVIRSKSGETGWATSSMRAIEGAKPIDPEAFPFFLLYMDVCPCVSMCIMWKRAGPYYLWMVVFCVVVARSGRMGSTSNSLFSLCPHLMGGGSVEWDVHDGLCGWTEPMRYILSFTNRCVLTCAAARTFWGVAAKESTRSDQKSVVARTRTTVSGPCPSRTA